jgi:hypothetical protein
MREGEGYLLAAKFVQRSIIMEKQLDRDMGYLGDLGVSREEYRVQVETMQGSGPWMICGDCIALLNLSKGDLIAARECARKWWGDKTVLGHMPQSTGRQRDKKPAFILIYGNGFCPSRNEAGMILHFWVEKRKGALGDDAGNVRCDVLEFTHGGNPTEFLNLKSQVTKQFSGHVIDDMLIVDKRSGSPKQLSLFAVWTPEDAGFIEGILGIAPGLSQREEKKEKWRWWPF